MVHLDVDEQKLPYHEEDMNPSTDFNAMSETCVQGRNGFKNRHGKFPGDIPPYRPSPGKIIKKFQNHLFPCKNDRFFNFHPTCPPAIAQMQAWPVRPCLRINTPPSSTMKSRTSGAVNSS